MTLVPHDASVPVKDAFRAVHARIDEISKKDTNLHGFRITNAGDARAGADYVTLRQLRDISKDPHVVTQVRIIQETLGVGPWTRVGTVTKLTSPGDQVIIGLTASVSTSPVLHVRKAAAAAFPTIQTADHFLVENSGNTSVVLITGATSVGAIKFYGSGDSAPDSTISYNRSTRALSLNAATVVRVTITSAGSVLLAAAGALTTTATDGFTYIPSCAGTPTGVPTAQTGMIPIVYDSTNNIFYAYSGGAWRTH